MSIDVVKFKIVAPEQNAAIARLGVAMVDYLQQYASTERPRRAVEIMDYLGVGSDSTIQIIAHDLRGRHRIPLASLCKQPYGYWIAKDRADLASTEEHLHSRARSILYALVGIKRAFPDAIQGELEL